MLGLVMVAGVVTMLVSLNAGAAEPGESSGEFGAASDGESPKAAKDYKLQASDPDKPRDPAEEAAKKKAAADAELAKKSGKPVEAAPPFYQTWQFWVVASVVVVAAAGAIVGGIYVNKSINGGDVAACPMDRSCFGEGR
jgi:hypothetical protein